MCNLIANANGQGFPPLRSDKTKRLMKKVILLVWVSMLSLLSLAQPPEKNLPPEHLQIRYEPQWWPDRILLTPATDPATSVTVTWRTRAEVRTAFAEIALADPSPEFDEYEKDYQAATELLVSEFARAAYHKVTFTDLQPATLYAYRVGAGDYWSEWVQFRTAAAGPEPFTFLYLGDAQNDLHEHWSRAIRAAYREAPQADWVLHAGDLINHSQNDYEWGEWFQAGGFIHRSMPVVVPPGNHEYIKNAEKRKVGISPFWGAQFNFPDNGPEGLEDRCFYVDYQGARIISMDSNADFERQADWLADVLEDNSNQWTIVTFHHPVISPSGDRQCEEVQQLWKPLLDQYQVDLVLQGHDHSYARGQGLITGTNPYENDSKVVYVVSVSGPKMYSITEQPWMDRAAENTQLFQVIEVMEKEIRYRAYTVDGMLYDGFVIHKRPGKTNKVKALKISSKKGRRFENTLTKPER